MKPDLSINFVEIKLKKKMVFDKYANFTIVFIGLMASIMVTCCVNICAETPSDNQIASLKIAKNIIK